MSTHGITVANLNSCAENTNVANERNSGTSTAIISCNGSQQQQWMCEPNANNNINNGPSSVKIAHPTVTSMSTTTSASSASSIVNGTVAHHHQHVERSANNGSGNTTTTPHNTDEPVLVSSATSTSCISLLQCKHDFNTGIFLVDGMGHGVLVNGESSESPEQHQHNTMMGSPPQHPSLFQYGLPNPEEAFAQVNNVPGNNPSPVCIRVDSAVESSNNSVPSSSCNKNQRTSVTTLPVPSPVVNVTTTDINNASSSGGSSSGGSSPAKNALISTEAQTEDLPALAPPPPPQRNREHRKRERREHRRDRHRNGRSNSSATDGSPNRPHRLSRSKAIHNASSSTGSTIGHGEEINRTPNNSANSAVSNCTPQRSGSSNSPHYHTTTDGLPDLLNAHPLPPPYSTLPHNQDPRRMGIVGGNVPLPPPPPNILPPPPLLSHHHHPPPPPLMPSNGAPPPPPPHPPNCLPPSAQPVRYHFPPVARTSRR